MANSYTEFSWQREYWEEEEEEEGGATSQMERKMCGGYRVEVTQPHKRIEIKKIRVNLSCKS